MFSLAQPRQVQLKNAVLAVASMHATATTCNDFAHLYRVRGEPAVTVLNSNSGLHAHVVEGFATVVDKTLNASCISCSAFHTGSLLVVEGADSFCVSLTAPGDTTSP